MIEILIHIRCEKCGSESTDSFHKSETGEGRKFDNIENNARNAVTELYQKPNLLWCKTCGMKTIQRGIAVEVKETENDQQSYPTQST